MIQQSFADAYGDSPTGVWAAPGRVNLIGEHTDYNDGFVLPFALSLRARAAVRLREDGPLRARSVQVPAEPLEIPVAALTPGAVPGWGAYVAGVVWALGEAGHRVPGADLVLDGDVPTGAGLSSSAALECAVVHALDDLLGLGLPRAEQAALARRAENDFVGAPTGMLDQMAAMFGRAGEAVFLDCRSLEVERVPLDLDALGLRVLVVDTRVSHAHTESGYGERRRMCEDAARTLGVPALRDVALADLDDALAKLDDPVQRRRVRHVVTEDDRVLQVVRLLRGGDVRSTGPLLTASHASMRNDYEISVPQLDTAVEVAIGTGALGARMTGGGFGGSAIALVPEADLAPVTAAVEKAFAASGWLEPRTFVAVPSDGARRLG
ncbi:MAG: galactokinase [Actinomycetota bacterium]|nr:galactokinase [Actinomycetota bacterium]